MTPSLDTLRPRAPMWIAVGVVSLALHGALAAGLSAYEPPAEPEKVVIPVSVRVVQPPPPEPEPPPPPPPEPEPPPPPPEPEVPREPVVQKDPPPPPKKKPRKKPRKAPEKPEPPAPPPADPQPDAPVEPPPLMGIDLSGTATSTTGIAVPQGVATGSRDGVAGGTGKPGPRKPTPPAPGPDEGEAIVPVAGVTELPKLIHDVDPDYPDELKRKGIQGKVVLSVVVGTDGKVETVKLVGRLHPELDTLARRAAYKLRFRPATVRGTPVAVRIPYTFYFVID